MPLRMDAESRSAYNRLESVLLDESANPTKLPLALLKSITNDFSDAQEIGRGGFAAVYKGMIGNRTVAVKKLFNAIDEKKFEQEVQCIMKARHRNIVRFLGYCADTQGEIIDYAGKFVVADLRNWLLCFEFVPKGSLQQYISDVSCGLEWRVRYKMIRGICEGLHHLHEKRIVHLDLKPANILVDESMVPKIADFGLSRCFDEDQSKAITSKLIGTVGYLAPEFYSGKVTFALDIYSLGVVIIEIVTGEKGHPTINAVLKSWVDRLKTSLREPQLQQIKTCVEIGVMCIDSNPAKRPKTKCIIETFKELGSMDEFFEAGPDTAFNIETIQKPLDQFTAAPMVSQDQFFSIVHFAPNWTYEGSKTKILVGGKIINKSQIMERCKWSCMFGEVEVPAQMLADETLLCYSPPHKPGKVRFYITCSNRLACSEVHEFEFRPNDPQYMDAPSPHGATNKVYFQIRLVKLLSLGPDELLPIIPNPSLHMIELSKNISSLVTKNDEWSNLLKLANDNKLSTDDQKDEFLETFIKAKLVVWLLNKIGVGGEGPSVLDDEGQGVLHIAAALGYDWAIRPIVSAGVNINFRDVHGWTALHWAAFCGTERTVVSLISLGAASGALTCPPTTDLSFGSTPANLAHANGHNGIAAFLSEVALTSHLDSLELNKDGFETGPPDIADSLRVVRSAIEAADRIYQVLGMQCDF